MRRLDLLLTGLLASYGGTAVAAPPSNLNAFAGSWSVAPMRNGPAKAGSEPPHGQPPSDGRRPPRDEGGGPGGAGGRGHGGGPPPGGDRPRGGRPADADDTSKQSERGERGLARAFADHVTITPLKQRIRFDDGEHAVELDRDGMNVSGPGVGGTVALTATTPDLVIDTLTSSGASLRERYHLADDGRHLELHVTLKTPGSSSAREFVRVFDRAVAAQPDDAPPPPPPR